MLKPVLALSLAMPCLVRAADPLRLDDGRPFVCVYYFGHWWEPWRSDDEVIRADFRRLARMGVSVVALDHEWSQAIDGHWRWLDREHRLAKEAGLQILPWLSLKCWSDMGEGDRPRLVREWFGVDLCFGENQDGTRGAVQIWDDATIKAGAAYAAMYLDRYRDAALLRVKWMGQDRPVVALSVELGWTGGFDDATTIMFTRWLRNVYGDDIAKLNAAWGTHYASFWDVDPHDTQVFDYANLQTGGAKHPQAVEDHIEFRSQLISDSLGVMAARLRRTHPEVLILAEVPYQFLFEHPHAQAYRVQYACNPSCLRSADIIFFRCGSLLSAESAAFTDTWTRQTGQPAILAYRTYSDWCEERSAEEIARLAEAYAVSTAAHGSGFGFYSWNEMGDTHLAPSLPEDQDKPGALTREQSERGLALMAAMVRRYLEIVGQ